MYRGTAGLYRHGKFQARSDFIRTVQRLETRVEELEAHEDLRDLEKAIVENDGKPLVPWDQAKTQLDLD